MGTMLSHLDKVNKYSYDGKKGVIVTNHKKERVISPVFQHALGLECSVIAPAFNTDSYGSFSGEVPRTRTPVETLRMKCLEGMKYSGAKIGIASEGSYGSHPTIPFLNASQEYMIFVDLEHHIEIVESNLFTDITVFHERLNSKNQTLKFLRNFNFPNQGVLLKNSAGELLSKSVKTISDVLVIAENEWRGGSEIIIESDLRAMHNPKRMRTIEKLALKLVKRIKQLCPECETPGFGPIDRISGAACSNCGKVSTRTLAIKYACNHCNYSESRVKKLFIDPMHCNWCNP